AAGCLPSLQATGAVSGPITITASASSLSSGATTFTILTGAADHLVFTNSTTDLAAGSTRTLSAEVRDAAGNLESGDNATVITFAKTGGAGTVNGLGTATASGGIAYKNVNGELAGSITIGAAATSLTSDTTTFSVVAGAADHLAFTNSSATPTSGTSRTLTIEMRDAGGNLVTG